MCACVSFEPYELQRTFHHATNYCIIEELTALGPAKTISICANFNQASLIFKCTAKPAAQVVPQARGPIAKSAHYNNDHQQQQQREEQAGKQL